MLTRLVPVESLIIGEQSKAMYLEKGEPIGVQNLCERGVELMFSIKDLERGHSVKVELEGRIHDKTQNA